MPLDTGNVLKKIYPCIFAVVFLGICVTPLFQSDVNLATLQGNFLGRAQLIDAFSTLRMGLGDRVFPNVLVGKDGWLYLTGDASIDDYQGSNLFSHRQLGVYQKRLDLVNAQLRQRGITLVVVFAPDKSTIYPQFMPDQIQKVKDTSRLEQFINYMQKNGQTPIIDLRPDLIQASRSGPVFYKTDSHWNTKAYYIAYRDILLRLSQYYPGLVPHPLSDFEAPAPRLITLDLALNGLGMPGLKEYYGDLRPGFAQGIGYFKIAQSDGHFLEFFQNPNQNLPSVLTVNDSFLIPVLPDLAPHFSRMTSIYRTPIPSGTLSMDWVNQAHPDVVILEYAERYLNFDFFVPADR